MNLTAPQIRDLQFFLIGLNLYSGKADGIYGTMTRNAVRLFQKNNGLTPDGIAGQKTIEKAVSMGLWRAEYPMKPNFAPLSNSQRIQLFGRFRYEATNDLADRDAIRILGDWEDKNIVTVRIPQLIKIKGNDMVRCHRLVANQFVQVFQDWDNAGLMPLVLSWEGSYYPRFVRGRYGVLSNHSWGSAFDINYAWNMLGQTPALLGEKGSVRSLVGIAHKNGFYWGGHFNRRDGMHFEIFKIV